MCGIVAMINRTKRDFWDRDMELLEHMLIINSLRGKDSVGVFSTYRNNEVEALKLGSNIFNLFRCGEWSALKDKMKKRGRIIVGHNRAATRGNVTTENAHPFAENNIILVHNGTLYSHDKLSDKQEFDVDSHAIAAALSEGDVEEVLPKLHGAYALVWYDTEKKKLFMVRNNERPLSLIVTDDMYVISSEPGIATLPMQRQNRKIEGVHMVPAGLLVEFSMNGEMKQREIKTTPEYTTHTYYGKQTQKETKTAEDSVWEQHLKDCSVENDEDFVEDDLPFVLGEVANNSPSNNSTSQSCALTSVKKTVLEDQATSTTVVGPTRTNVLHFASTLSVKELDLISCTNTARLQIKHPTLVRGKLVIFKPLEVSRNPTNGHFQFRGKLHELGEELIDVLGYYPEDRSMADLEKKFRNQYCVGRVLYVTRTTGGESVYLQNVKEASDTRVFSGYRIPALTWSNITDRLCCGTCGRTLHTMDREFTAVTLKTQIQPHHEQPVNMASVVCANCIEESMTGAIKDEFKNKRREQWISSGYEGIVQYHAPSEHTPDLEAAEDASTLIEKARGNPAVQDREQLSPGTGKFRGKIIVLPGNTTLQ